MNNYLEKNRQLNALTSIRFFVALHVVLYHLFSNGYLNFYLKSQNYDSSNLINIVLLSWLKTGFVSVSLFFVLSGFILVYANKDREIETYDQHLLFYIARFSRIYPTYLFALILTLPLIGSLWLSGQKSFASIIGGLILNLSLTQSWIAPAALSWNAPGWSLSVELFFYMTFLILYLAIRKANGLKLIYIAGIALALGMLFPILYAVYSPDGLPSSQWAHAYFDDAPFLISLKFFPVARLHEFIIGIVAGVLFIKNRSEISDWFFYAIATICLVLYICGLTLMPERLFPLQHNGLMAPLFAIVIFSIAKTKLNTTIKFNSPLEILGKSSFALYLIHGPILLSLQYFFLKNISNYNEAAAFYLVLSMTILMSIAIHYYIEEPMRKFSQRFFISVFSKSQAHNA